MGYNRRIIFNNSCFKLECVNKNYPFKNFTNNSKKLK